MPSTKRPRHARGAHRTNGAAKSIRCRVHRHCSETFVDATDKRLATQHSGACAQVATVVLPSLRCFELTSRLRLHCLTAQPATNMLHPPRQKASRLVRWNVASLVAFAALVASIDVSATSVHAATPNHDGQFGTRAGAV